MIGIATPHLAEDWWAQLGGDGLLAAHVMDDIQIVSEEDQALLDGEALIRDLLEQARKVRSVAERHRWRCNIAHHRHLRHGETR